MKNSTAEHLKALGKFLIKSGKVRETFLTSDLLTNYTDDNKDHGPKPWVVDIEELTVNNDNFRTTEWTGEYFQLTVMSLEPGEDIGVEMHKNVDQFIRIEQGDVEVFLGESQDDLGKAKTASDDFAIFIPAGTWHNIKNIGEDEVKLYSIYAKPNHPKGTIHKTKEEAEEAEDH